MMRDFYTIQTFVNSKIFNYKQHNIPFNNLIPILRYIYCHYVTFAIYVQKSERFPLPEIVFARKRKKKEKHYYKINTSFATLMESKKSWLRHVFIVPT